VFRTSRSRVSKRSRREILAVPVARLRGVEPLARGFEVGDRGLPEEPDASRPFTFRTVTGSGVSPNVSPRPANHGDFAALVLHGFLSPKQAAERLGVHRETIYRLCARGELPHVRVGAAIRVDLGGYIAGKGT
jgi:excisionase family DNA binding protein